MAYTLPGGTILSYLAKTADYTISAIDDSTIDCTANSFTVTFPTAVGIAGRTYIIKNSGNGVITVVGDGGQTIDGAATDLLAPGIARTYQSDGANWIIVTTSRPFTQGDSVEDATGGLIQDAQARTAVNTLINRLETLGLIDTD